MAGGGVLPYAVAHALFSENLLETLPPSIGQLSELQYLYLKSNRLAAFPSEVINQWTHLRILDVSAPLIHETSNPQNSLWVDHPRGGHVCCGSIPYTGDSVIGLEHPSHFALSGQFGGRPPLGAPLTLVPLERFPVVDVRRESAPASSVSAQPALAGRIAAMPPLGQIVQLANSIAAGSPISVGPSSRGAGVSGNLPNSLRGHVDSASTSMPQSASRVVSAPPSEEELFGLLEEVSGAIHIPNREYLWQVACDMLTRFRRQCQEALTWSNLRACAANEENVPSRHYDHFERLVLSQMVRALAKRVY